MSGWSFNGWAILTTPSEPLGRRRRVARTRGASNRLLAGDSATIRHTCILTRQMQRTFRSASPDGGRMTRPVLVHRSSGRIHTLRLPPCVLRTRSSSGMLWHQATLAQIIAGARTSQLLRRSRPVPSTARAANSQSLLAFSENATNYVISVSAQLNNQGPQPNKQVIGSMLQASQSLEAVKQAASANIMSATANSSAKQQASAQQAKQMQINILIEAIAALIALLNRDLMVLDFAGAFMVALILVDLTNQLTRLV